MVFYPAFDLGAFRFAVARYAKLLIRARWKCESGFLSDVELTAWRLSNIRDDRVPAWRLLEDAARALAVLNYDFLPRCGSGGIEETDESTPVGRLINEVVALVACQACGPYHNQELITAALELRQERPLDWTALVDWSRLPQIRADLDRLPDAPINLTTDASEVPSRDTEASSLNIFRRETNGWNVRYDGGEWLAFPSAPGMFYIHHLLSQPATDCQVSELAAAWNRYQVSGSMRAESSCEEGGLSVDGSRNDGVVIDGEGLRVARAEFEYIHEELMRAEADNDTARIDRLREDRRNLANSVTESTKPRGGRIHLGDRNKKELNRVTSAIKRTIENISKKHPVLGRHLELAIKTGYRCRYAPEKPLIWDL